MGNDGARDGISWGSCMRFDCVNRDTDVCDKCIREDLYLKEYESDDFKQGEG